MPPSGLDASLRFFRPPDAARYAADLFRESFNADFPVPRDGVLPVPTPPPAWRQYVATYRWPEGAEETVGFCNWIRHGDIYLHGGLCVKKNFYRRLPIDQFEEMRSRGGLATMMTDAAAGDLADCAAWFAYCGDSMSWAAISRSGYVATHREHVVVKWFRAPAQAEQLCLIDEVAAIGPF
jgi:hypothetical protein